MPVQAPALVLAAALLAAPAFAAAQDQGGSGGGGGDDAICTDRPTKVYSTCTAPAGHWQVETDLFNGTFQRQDGVTTDTYYATNPTLKYGVSKSLDLEVNLAPYEVVRTHGGGSDSTLGGVGDLYLRAKYAAYAPDGGKLTVSLLPYVKAPLARDGVGNGAWEGGTAVAVGYKLTDKWTLQVAPELDAYGDQAGGGSHLNHIEVVNLGYQLPHDLTVSAELWGDWDYDPAGTMRQYSADVAVAWVVGKTSQLDAGLNFGLNRQTPGVQAYVGVSHRF